jgi:hypothetical protein
LTRTQESAGQRRVYSLGVADGICNNCGTTLVGEFCHRCGQREVDEWKSIGSIARHVWNELVSLDYKTVRSVAALVYPGYLAAEFIAGRRGRYLGPLKVYFLAAALFFFIAPRATDFTFERQMALDWDGEFRAQVEKRIAETHMSRELFGERFGSRAQTVYTIAPILSVLTYTFLLRLLYRRRFPWLGPHIVFAMYYTAFMYIVALFIHGINNVFEPPNGYVLIAVQCAIVVPFMFVALRRVYGERPGLTFVKTLTLLVLAFVIDMPVAIAATRLSITLT